MSGSPTLLYLSAIVALIKILAMVVLFVMVIYGTAVENDPKRKFTEMLTCVAIITIIVGMQTFIPRMVSKESKTLGDMLTAWDPSPLWKG